MTRGTLCDRYLVLVTNLLKERQMPVTYCYSVLFYLNYISPKKYPKNVFSPSPAFK